MRLIVLGFLRAYNTMDGISYLSTGEQRTLAPKSLFRTQPVLHSFLAQKRALIVQSKSADGSLRINERTCRGAGLLFLGCLLAYWLVLPATSSHV